MKTKKILQLLCCSLFLSALLNPIYGLKPPANLVEIGDIVNNPGKYNNSFVTIQGLVSQYTPATASTTANYLLKSDYGAIIKINTSDGNPETNQKYEVSGTIVIDLVNNEALMIEKSRTNLTPPPPIPGTGSQNPQMMWYIIIGSIAVLFLLIIIYLIMRSRNNRFRDQIAPPYTSPSPIPIDPGARTTSIGDSDFKTIKINLGGPKTLKLIPGKLEIVTGLDKGKEFRMNAIPGPNGCIITIGREKLSGDAEFSHIQLLEKTVSRKQAEIHYRENKLFVKNLSETNYTQLNGLELRLDEMAEVKPTSIIKTGEVEFRYIV